MKYALLGQGISYTVSPRVHAAISAATGRACVYDVCDVPPEALDETLRGLFAHTDGFNVTQPYKEVVRTAALDETARAIGAVNTVSTRDGTGYNTDAYGFRAALERAGMFPADGTPVLVLGAGGAARSALYVLRHTRPTVVNRSVDRARAVCAALGLNADVRAPGEARGSWPLVVNCTTLGRNGEMSLPPSVSLDETRACFDMIYAPAETPLLAAARARGIAVENGFSMLVFQAIRAREIWEGIPIGAAERETIFSEVTK